MYRLATRKHFSKQTATRANDNIPRWFSTAPASASFSHIHIEDASSSSETSHNLLNWQQMPQKSHDYRLEPDIPVNLRPSLTHLKHLEPRCDSPREIKIEPFKSPFSDINASSAYSSQSTFKLLRSYLILSLCQFKPLVNNAQSLLKMMTSVFGEKITSALIKHTAFQQFCGGENLQEVHKTVEKLKNFNIKSMVVYEVEGDSVGQRMTRAEKEQLYDERAEGFRKSIQDAANLAEAGGVTPIKLTALGDPDLLAKESEQICELKSLFHQLAKKNHYSLILTDELFEEITKAKALQIINSNDSEQKMLFDNLKNMQVHAIASITDPHTSGVIDQIGWSHLFNNTSSNGLGFVQHKLTKTNLTEEEMESQALMLRRVDSLSKEAAGLNVRLLVDAEQTWFQPAIDRLTLCMQHRYNQTENTSNPIIFNTYQCYLKDSLVRIVEDIIRSERMNYHFGAKIVRGAYMNAERERAIERRYESPIWDTIGCTHSNFDASVETIIRDHLDKGKKSELFVSTHNRESLEFTIHLMNDLGIANEKRHFVHFAQLLGMSDYLTYALGDARNKNYSVYKFIPYGPTLETIPYLVRRAEENKDMLAQGRKDINLVKSELKKRVFG